MSKSVGLMGGLGNQLFQLSFALSLGDEEIIDIIPIFDNVRQNSSGHPEIISLHLPPNIRVSAEEIALGFLEMRLLRYGLRLSASGQQRFGSRFFFKILNLVETRVGRRVQYAQGLGSQIELCPSDLDVLYLGYFQSQFFSQVDNVKIQMMNLRPKLPVAELEELIIEVKREHPIMLHVRLTDYLNESQFGVPSTEYYRHGVEKVFQEIGERPIWVFSDDSKNVWNYLPSKFHRLMKIVEPHLGTADTWELMRHFEGYVIANSSFSWWAAYLKYSSDAPVVLPWPWFDNEVHLPADLVPSSWHTIDKYCHIKTTY